MINLKDLLHSNKALILIGGMCLLYAQAGAQNTFTSTGAKLPRHYFNTIITIDSYRKPDKPLKDTSDMIGKRLKSYGVKQLDISFCIPLATFEDHSDTNVIKNSHILLTGNYTLLRPVFDGLSQHRLVKLGVGIRYIFNTGKKGVWFVDAAPFVTKDAAFDSKAYFRLASTIVYSHNVSSSLNWRLGITKSFLWGNRFYWPFIGLRVGRLDKVNFSIQFPRSASLNMPLNSKLILSFYTRPQGGMYNFSNHDTLYPRKQTATFNFTRYELNTGLRLDVRVGKNFNFYVATGVSSRNNITFYSERANKSRPRLPYKTYFYSQDIGRTLFFNLGLVLKLGKTRSYFNDKNIYDAINLNNTMNNNGNTQIPLLPKKKKSDLNLESVRDLVDYNDF